MRTCYLIPLDILKYQNTIKVQIYWVLWITVMNSFRQADLVISLGGKSTIDECMVYGTPGIFIPIKNHFEQEHRANLVGFKYDDIFKLDGLIEEKLRSV